MSKEVDFTAATTVSTPSGNTVDIGEKENHFYILEQRDIEFVIDMAWTRYERKARFDYWGNFVIGLIIGLIIMSILK